MKIAVASDDERGVAGHPGRVRGFVILARRDGIYRRVEYRLNPMAHHHASRGEGNHQGHHDHGSLVGALGDCEALIAAGIGPRLVDDLNAYRISVYVSDAATVEEAAARLASGRLQPLRSGGACPEH
jgi:predicted Fe-Mo cluster-binding NifX family protein